MKDLDAFKEAIQDAVSEYSCDNNQQDFTAMVKIYVVAGWTSVEVVEYTDTSVEADEYDDSEE